MNEGRVSSTMDTGNIACPFFVMHGKREIVCEGMVDNSQNWTKFKTAEDKCFHQCTYCENLYTKCEVYLSIRHWKWAEDDD